jgi:hypothetical protein
MKRLIFVVLIALLFIVASTALAQSSGYDLTRNTIDGGGGDSIGGGYTLVGTIGQPDAGTAMTGGGFTLAGGFWISGAGQYHVYLPVVIK